MGAAYGSCGERCMAIPIVVAVGDATADAVVAGLKTEIAKMKVGPGTDPSGESGRSTRARRAWVTAAGTRATVSAASAGWRVGVGASSRATMASTVPFGLGDPFLARDRWLAASSSARRHLDRSRRRTRRR